MVDLFHNVKIKGSCNVFISSSFFFLTSKLHKTVDIKLLSVLKYHLAEMSCFVPSSGQNVRRQNVHPPCLYFTPNKDYVVCGMSIMFSAHVESKDCLVHCKL